MPLYVNFGDVFMHHSCQRSFLSTYTFIFCLSQPCLTYTTNSLLLELNNAGNDWNLLDRCATSIHFALCHFQHTLSLWLLLMLLLLLTNSMSVIFCMVLLFSWRRDFTYFTGCKAAMNRLNVYIHLILIYIL